MKHKSQILKEFAKLAVADIAFPDKKPLQRFEQPQSNDTLEKKVFVFFQTNPPKNDQDINNFATQENIEPEKVKEKIYEILASFLCAGRYASYNGEPINEDSIRIGTEVEMEHTINPLIARRIALDHLAEYQDYYIRLKKMEEEAEKNKAE